VSRETLIKLDSLEKIIAALKMGDYYSVLEQADELSVTLEEVEPYLFWDAAKYTRNCIAKDPYFELILLCWEPGQKTEIHCHNNQECWVKVIKGCFAESLYSFNEDTGEMNFINTDTFSAQEVTAMEDLSLYHSLANISTGQSVSLHLYMKPIAVCDIYDFKNKSVKEVSLSYYSMEGNRV
jgi:cysteine dioxygenase